MQEIQVRSLGQENTLEKEMASHSSILAWEILWKEKPGGLQSVGSQEWDMIEWLNKKTDSDFLIAKILPPLPYCLFSLYVYS